MNLQGKTVVVLGLGESGRAAAELLLQQGAAVIVRDSQTSERLEHMATGLRQLGARVELTESAFSPIQPDLAVLSPGVDPCTPMVTRLREKNVPLIGEVELAWSFCSAPVIAITGTNGKSTTTELIAAILNAAGRRTIACGNIGKPFSDVIRDKHDLDVITLEVSSFQLESIQTFAPRVAVFLNFAADHLDRYPSMDEYFAAKLRIFENQTAQDFAVVNSSLPLPALRARRTTIHAYGAEADYVFKDGWLCRGPEQILEQSTTRLRGPHNAENQLAALAVADLLQLPRSSTIQALRAYQPLPHRCEIVRVLDGVTWINDSKATNLHSLESALPGMNPPCVLIAGGKDKGFDYATIRALIACHVADAVLIGEARCAMRAAWSQSTRCHDATDLADAVTMARRLARPGQSVLLSPGCSSYDMFKNFEERGRIFRELVQNLT